MKKLLIAILICLMCCGVADAQHNLTSPQRGQPSGAGDPLRGPGGVGAAASCGTIQSQANTPSDAIVGAGTTNTYIAGMFTASATTIIKTLYVYLKDSGTPTGYTMDIALCTTSGGAPTTTCTDMDSGVSGELTSSYVKTKFNITAGYAITSGTVYAIRLHSDQIDASNYYRAGYDGTIVTNSVKNSEDGTTWANIDSTAVIAYEISSCLE